MRSSTLSVLLELPLIGLISSFDRGTDDWSTATDTTSGPAAYPGLLAPETSVAFCTCCAIACASRSRYRLIGAEDIRTLIPAPDLDRTRAIKPFGSSGNIPNRSDSSIPSTTIGVVSFSSRLACIADTSASYRLCHASDAAYLAVRRHSGEAIHRSVELTNLRLMLARVESTLLDAPPMPAPWLAERWSPLAGCHANPPHIDANEASDPRHTSCDTIDDSASCARDHSMFNAASSPTAL